MNVATPMELELASQSGGHRLAASLFVPERAPRAAVLIAGAMGVKRRYYAPFASHLREQGVAVLTFDYRGIGGSRPKSLRRFEATVHGWAEDDLPGMLSFLEERFPKTPLLYVGHSVGGQLLGLVPGVERVAGAAMVAAQVGYWKLWPGLPKVGMWLLWHAGIPLLSRAFGYFPMGRLGMGEDLPAGVAREWARWGRHPEYLFGFLQERTAAAFHAFHQPLLSYAIADDGYAPVPTVRALFDRYQSSDKSFQVLTPTDAGLKKLGHFGFFRPQAKALWEAPTRWLLQRASVA